MISSSPFNFSCLFCNNNRWLAIFALVITITACDNPDLTNFKTPLKNDTFGTNSVDTLSLIIRTKLLDSIPSNNFTKDPIGCYIDGITGKTVASSYFNFRLPSATIKLPATVVVNSVKLTLRYSGNYFGNITEQQTFNIYELAQKLKYDSTYYSSHKTACYPEPVGVWKGFLKPEDTLLTITLSNEFGQKLLSASGKQLILNDSFQAYFKGLTIIPDGNVFMGSIVYFILNHVKTTLSVYYNDSSVVVFPVNGYSARYANYNHDFSGSIIETQVNNPNVEYSELPLQPMSGTKITIQIPYIKHLVDSGLISIHKAEITFPTDINSPYKSTAPASLLLLQTDTLNRLISIVDRTENYYGGLQNTSKTSYTFIITRYIQQLLKEYVDYPDFIERNILTVIIPSDNPITASPVIIKNLDAGGKNVIKLKLWYSRL